MTWADRSAASPRQSRPPVEMVVAWWWSGVHTPFSALNNGFGTDFALYAKTLLQQAIATKVAAIGVTDYFSIDGYRRLRALIADPDKLGRLIGVDLVDQARAILLLPNVELRTSVIISRPGGEDSRVNFHVMFSEDLAPDEIDEHFLRELKFTAQGMPSSQDERWSVTRPNLEALGQRLKIEHATFRSSGDFFVGTMNAVVTHEEVTHVLDRQTSRFGERFLLVVPADEDLSECSWDGQAHHTRKLFIQKSHMLFSSNVGTRAFGLGRKHQTVDAFLAEFKSLKPCIHGSDAHSFESLFEPAGRRYLWIKADPTFLGLRQVLNEPEDRVFIGLLPPVSKGSMHVLPVLSGVSTFGKF